MGMHIKTNEHLPPWWASQHAECHLVGPLDVSTPLYQEGVQNSLPEQGGGAPLGKA